MPSARRSPCDLLFSSISDAVSSTLARLIIADEGWASRLHEIECALATTVKSFHTSGFEGSLSILAHALGATFATKDAFKILPKEGEMHWYCSTFFWYPMGCLVYVPNDTYQKRVSMKYAHIEVLSHAVPVPLQ
jgi:hypothetical protein